VIASRDGKILAVGGGCTEVWRPAQPQLLFRPPMSRSVSISRNGKMLATASPGGVYLFDVGRGKLTSKYVTSGAAVVDFSPDGRLAVACGTRVRLVDVKTAVALPQTFTSSATGLTSVTFSSDGCLLAAGGRDGSVTVWDTNTGTQRYHFWLREKSWGAILAIAMFGVWLLVWFVPSMRRKHKDGRRTYRSGG
jgi:WD40 repeat protein